MKRLADFRVRVAVAGTKAAIAWKSAGAWGGFKTFLDMCEIHVDLGTGFVSLTFDTTPGYVDTQLFPAAPGKWTYKAIYRLNDEQVGQWSDVASISVMS